MNWGGVETVTYVSCDLISILINGLKEFYFIRYLEDVLNCILKKTIYQLC